MKDETLQQRRREAKERLAQWGQTIALCEERQEALLRVVELKEESKELLAGNEESKALRAMYQCYEDELGRMQEGVRQLLEGRLEVDRVIATLTVQEQTFIQLRFEKQYGYEAIAQRLYQSRANCFRIQDRVLDKLARLEKG